MNHAPTTVEAIRIIAECIREVGSIPSGHLYAMLIAHGIDMKTYDDIIDTLQGANLIQCARHELVWIGPTLAKDPQDNRRTRQSTTVA